MFARDRLGAVGYPSPVSDKVTTPATLSPPFYYDWRFLLAIVLLALLFFVLVVALLCYTGRRRRRAKGACFFTTN